MSNTIDTEFEYDILTPEEVAQYLRKSTSWVYKNWQALGGRKLGGSLFFPKKEDLYECLFCKRQGQGVALAYFDSEHFVPPAEWEDIYDSSTVNDIWLDCYEDRIFFIDDLLIITG